MACSEGSDEPAHLPDLPEPSPLANRMKVDDCSGQQLDL